MPPMHEPKPSREDLLRIAAEVWAGTRPVSDLQKYGISLGETISGEDAREQLLAELEALDDDVGDIPR